MAFLISGGHTLLVLARRVGDYTILGSTIDDSIGEALDKASRMLNIHVEDGSSPAAALEKLAEMHGSKSSIRFPLPLEKEPGMNFSFSGLKTALKYSLVDHDPTDSGVKASIAHEFQKATTAHLEDRLRKAIKIVQREDVKDVIICGGVARNKYIGQHLRAIIEDNGMNAKFAPVEYCCDNAVMIGWAAIENILDRRLPLEPNELVDVLPDWPLDTIKLKT